MFAGCAFAFGSLDRFGDALGPIPRLVGDLVTRLTIGVTRLTIGVTRLTIGGSFIGPLGRIGDSFRRPFAEPPGDALRLAIVGIGTARDCSSAAAACPCGFA